MNEECCGKCMWHIRSESDWTCSNDEAEAYGLETEYSDSCEEFCDREN